VQAAAHAFKASGWGTPATTWRVMGSPAARQSASQGASQSMSCTPRLEAGAQRCPARLGLTPPPEATAGFLRNAGA
jgi:hypothetical protein